MRRFRLHLALLGLLEDKLERVTVAYDVPAEELAALCQRFNPARLEVIVHQHVPMFHLEYRFDDSDGWHGHFHRVRDRNGADHAVLTDPAGRTTIFSDRPESCAGRLAELRCLGLRHFRIELLAEDPRQIKALLDRFAHRFVACP